MTSWFDDKIKKQLRESWSCISKMREQEEQNAIPETIMVNGKSRPTMNSLGKPIHSTKEGIENFWKWFGDSKVVDDDGRPMVVYHGGNGGISSFDPGLAGSVQYSDWGNGVYFTPSKWQADSYKKESDKTVDDESNALWDQMETLAKKYGTSTMGVSLDLSKGKINQEQYNNIKKLEGQWRDARSNASKYGTGEVYDVYLKIEHPIIEIGGSMSDPLLADRARSSKKDGIVILRGNGSIDEIVAFNSTQIKSASGNNGDFSGNNANITKESNNNMITESYKDEKSDSFCYMLYVLPEDEGQFTKMQKDLDLKGELTESGKFHITVRYVKDDNYQPLIDHLKGLELPVLKGKCKGFELFGKEKDALVIEMEGDELHNWFNKINDWLVEKGFPKSDFPDYKPHITLTYDKGIEKPEWKKEYEKEVTFKLHVVTGSDYNEVFRLRV